MNAPDRSDVLAAVRRNPGGIKPLTAAARGENSWMEGAALDRIDRTISAFTWARQSFTLGEMNCDATIASRDDNPAWRDAIQASRAASFVACTLAPQDALGAHASESGSRRLLFPEKDHSWRVSAVREAAQLTAAE